MEDNNSCYRLLKLWHLILLPAILVACYRPAEKVTPNEIDLSKVSADTILWDMQALYEPPGYRVVDSGHVLSIVYESMVFNDTAREVFAYYSNPAILKGRETKKGEIFPGIVLAHGGTGRAFRQWVEKWASDGYAAIAYDMSGRDGLEFFNDKPGPKQDASTLFHNISTGLKDMWSVFAVGSTIRAHSLILSRPEVDINRTAITGISWGGYVTCIVAGLDHRFKAACPVYGCGFYEEMDLPSQRFSQMSESDAERWLMNIDPKQYLANIQCPILFINGNKDFYFGTSAYQKSYAMVENSLKHIKIQPDMRHSHPYGWEPLEIKYFFENVLNGGFPLPKVYAPEVLDSFIIAKYDSPVSAKYGELWYSKDTISNNKDRDWKVIRGEIETDHIIVKNPGNDMVLGFMYLRDHRNLSTSSDFFYQKASDLK